MCKNEESIAICVMSRKREKRFYEHEILNFSVDSYLLCTKRGCAGSWLENSKSNILYNVVLQKIESGDIVWKTSLLSKDFYTFSY